MHPTPELVAERPNQVWRGDITKLAGPAKGSWCYLYTVRDRDSRSVTGGLVATREHAEPARRFLGATAAKHASAPDSLTLPADRGRPLVAQSVVLLLGSLGSAPSHSRPHVSTDTPYSERQFKTRKDPPRFPDRFASLEEARTFCQQFFTWYNIDHHHQGIGLHTPAQVYTSAARGRRDGDVYFFTTAHPGAGVHRRGTGRASAPPADIDGGVSPAS